MEVKDLSTFLENIGIGPSSAKLFAVALFDDGWETPKSFARLTSKELREDYGFKRGHLCMVDDWCAREKKKSSENHVEDEARKMNEDGLREINENFTKYARCYHHGTRWDKWKGSGEGRNIVEQAMVEILKNDTYIGFSHNEKENSVYLIRESDWNGIGDESIGCEERPVPRGLSNKSGKSDKWKWHSLYIKNK